MVYVDTSALAKWYLNEAGSEEFVDYVHPLEDNTLRAALGLIGRLPNIALRTLDAIHLSVAQELAVPALATADQVMGNAGEALGLEVIRFGR